MRFHSMQTKIAVLSGVCVLSVTGALMVNGIIATGASQEFVGRTVGD